MSYGVRGTVLGVVLSLLFLTGAPAFAADSGGEATGTVTWSVRPAGASGPDGRAWVEQELDPGESATEHLAVRNLSEEEVTFRVSSADGFFGDNGRFSMLPSDQKSVDAGLWIEAPAQVTVPEGETAVVAFTTTVPENATPGDHAAGIAASVVSQQIGQDGATVGVESRVGFRVMTRVTGQLAPAATVTEVSWSYDGTWNPLSPGKAQASFQVVNAGNARLVVSGTVSAGGQSHDFPGADAIDQEILPGERRTFVVDVDGIWPSLFVPASLHVTPAVVGEGDGVAVTPIDLDVGFWAMPWPQLIVLAGVALLVVSSVWGRRRSKRRLESLLAQAREHGRREVETSDPAGASVSSTTP